MFTAEARNHNIISFSQYSFYAIVWGGFFKDHIVAPCGAGDIGHQVNGVFGDHFMFPAVI